MYRCPGGRVPPGAPPCAQEPSYSAFQTSTPPAIGPTSTVPTVASALRSAGAIDGKIYVVGGQADTTVASNRAYTP
jgi:hypothetical protein